MSNVRFPNILCKFFPSGIGGILLALLFTGCNSIQFFGTAVSPDVSISAAPASIPVGTASTLEVTAKNAIQVTVTGSDGSSYNLQPGGGSQVVSPRATTTYKAEATGLSGTKSASATLTVKTDPKPTIFITAYPTAMTAGSSSTLTVTAKNATQLIVTGTDGSKYTLHPGGETQKVTPGSTTTYTAVASGTGGKASAITKVTVTAHPKPSIKITADPDKIEAGSSSILTITADNATQAILTGSNGARFTLTATGGKHVAIPAETTTFTATASSAEGKASATVTVTVTPHPAPTVVITAKPDSIKAGGSSTLAVTAGNANEVIVTGTNGSTHVLKSNGGTLSVTPNETSTFTATASGLGGKASAKVTVAVTPDPLPVVSISAIPASITSGSSSILNVTAKNATLVQVTGTDGSRYTLQPSGGTQAVSPAATTTYTAVATGPGGKTSENKTVTVTPNPPPTVRITANPPSITAGSSSTLTVSAVYATQVTVTGTDGSKYTLYSSGGIQAVSPTSTTTYTAIAIGVGGKVSAASIVTVTANPAPAVTITANPNSIISGNSSALTVTATNATEVSVTGTDGSKYTLQPTGGMQAVSPTATTTYTAAATGAGGNASAGATVTVSAAGSLQSIDHVVFMLQENHTFDNYFGMLNPYRQANNFNVGDNGITYNVDGIDDKLTTISNADDEGTVYPLYKFTSTCIDDESSAWLASYGDVNTYHFGASRSILMNGFVHNAEGYADSCVEPGSGCSGNFTDLTGQRSMGYYDEGFLNYYYYMASQFALSDRWFSPVSSKSVDNRIATFTGGTTQGLVKDPGGDDHVGQLDIPNIFQELDTANVSWKIYYTVTQGFCLDEDDCPGGASAEYPATDFSDLNYSYQYLYENPNGAACTSPTVASSAVGDSSNSFCIDTAHIAPLSTYFSDLTDDTLPSFAFIEAGYGNNDEHPGSGQSILQGQAQVAKIVNSFMGSSSWNDSVFFMSYDEGGGPYDHVPPVSGFSNVNTNITKLGATPPDISTIAVNPDTSSQQPALYFPCLPLTPPGTPTLHCDLAPGDPGATSGDAAADNGFAAQLGFRLPNMIISPFTLKHYVSHTPMDHTAVIKFVENRFIGPAAHLTNRDAAQPDLLEFFDFNSIPWATPPMPPAPVSDDGSCTPASFAP